MAAKFDKFLGKIREWSSKASDISDSGAAGRAILRMATLAEIQSSVSGDALDAVADAMMLAPSRNLYNPAAKQVGKYITSAAGSSQGDIVAAAGWACTDWIPVTAGQDLTVSASGTKRVGASFFAAYGDLACIDGTYSASATLPLTLHVPAGATHVVVNLQSTTQPEPAWVQVEVGAEATPYVPFGDRYVVKASEVSPKIIEGGRLDKQTKILFTSPTECQIIGELDSSQIVQVVRLGGYVSHEASQVFNFVTESIDGTTYRNPSDDVAPIRALGATIGANHGYSMTKITVSGHGKTYADVGSIWSASSKQWVIVDITSANQLCITCRTDNTSFAGGTLTHVSGATSTASMTTSGVASVQWYQPTRDRSLTLYVDGRKTDDYSGTYGFKDSVRFVERYNIMAKPDIVEWLITQVGTATNITQYLAAPRIAVQIVYDFDPRGMCVISSDVTSLVGGEEFTDAMLTQSARMVPYAGNDVYYYLPDSLAFTHLSVNYDFATTPVLVSGTAPTTRIDITPARSEPTGQPVSRLVQYNNNFGHVTGYIPVRSAAESARRAECTVKFYQISNSSWKLYPMVSDRGTRTLARGETVSAVAIKGWYKRASGRTAQYFPRTGHGDYIYAEYHNVAALDAVPLPHHLHGRPLTLVDSRNAALISLGSADSVLIDVTCTGGYGYIILRAD